MEPCPGTAAAVSATVRATEGSGSMSVTACAPSLIEVPCSSLTTAARVSWAIRRNGCPYSSTRQTSSR